MSLEPPRLEFFGLPGSGKSTLARACWALLADREPRVVFGPSVTRDEVPICPRTLARLGLIGRSLPFDTAERRTVRLIAGLPQPSPKDRAKVLFNALTVAALYRRIGRSAGGFVLDQGVLQAIWSAYLRSPARFAAALWAGPLAAEAVPGRVYVCVTTPVATCIDRLVARSGQHSRLQATGLLRDDGLWERAAALYHGLVGVLPAAVGSGRPGMVMMDGLADPARSARQIVASLGGQLP